MAQQRNFRTRPAIRPQRRKRIWSRQHFELGPITDSPITARPFATFRTLGGDTLGGTVAAVRMAIGVETTTAGALNQNLYVVAGRIGNEGTASEVDGPLSQPHHDWFIWCPVYVGNSVGDSAATPVGAECAFNSMRKMEELGDDFFIVVQGEDVMAAAEVNLMVSTLLLLP